MKASEAFAALEAGKTVQMCSHHDRWHDLHWHKNCCFTVSAETKFRLAPEKPLRLWGNTCLLNGKTLVSSVGFNNDDGHWKVEFIEKTPEVEAALKEKGLL